MSKHNPIGRCNSQFKPVVTDLECPPVVAETAQELFLRGADELNLRRGMDNIAVAALVIAARKQGNPVEVSRAIEHWQAYNEDAICDSLSKKYVRRTIRTYNKDLSIETTIVRPDVLIEQFGERLDVPEAIAEIALRMHEIVAEEVTEVVANYSPKGVAAGALYLAGRLVDSEMDLTQHAIADEVNVAAVTIRERYQELRDTLLKVLTEQGKVPETHRKLIERSDATPSLYDEALREYEEFVVDEGRPADPNDEASSVKAGSRSQETTEVRTLEYYID